MQQLLPLVVPHTLPKDVSSVLIYLRASLGIWALNKDWRSISSVLIDLLIDFFLQDDSDGLIGKP